MRLSLAILSLLCLVAAATAASDASEPSTTSGRASSPAPDEYASLEALARAALRDARDGQAPTAAGSGWFLQIMAEFFKDINWKTIGEARDQIEAFIRRVDDFVRAFRRLTQRTTPSTTPSSGSSTASSVSSTTTPSPTAATDQAGAHDKPHGLPNIASSLDDIDELLFSAWGLRDAQAHPEKHEDRAALGRLGLIAKLYGKQQPQEDGFNKTESQSIKQMLNKVACFVGYMRLLNESQLMLAELDASKILTNLFFPSKPHWYSNLFG